MHSTRLYSKKWENEYDEIEIFVKGDLVLGTEALILFKNDEHVYNYQVGQIRDVITCGEDRQKYFDAVKKYLNSKECQDTITTGEFTTPEGQVYVGIIAPGENPYRKTLYITRRESEIIHKYLTEEPTCEKECLGEDETISNEVVFPDGIRMAIDVCGVQYRENEPTNTAWTQAVLFSKEGSELTCTDVCEDYLGTWELEYEGRTYSVTVKEAAELLYTSTVAIPQEQAQKIQDYLNGTPGKVKYPAEDWIVFDGISFADHRHLKLTITGKDAGGANYCFPDTEVTLISRDGKELATAMPVGHTSKELVGDWEVEYNNAVYRMHVIIDKPCVVIDHNKGTIEFPE